VFGSGAGVEEAFGHPCPVLSAFLMDQLCKRAGHPKALT
jgi:hypothetical protein